MISFRSARCALAVGAMLMAPACHNENAPSGSEGGVSSSASVSVSAPAARGPGDAAAASFYADRFRRKPSAAEMMDVGKELFFDPGLSASGKMSCATCHDPHFAYGPPNDRATQLGGPDSKSAGLRAVPSLRYLQALPSFSEHHFDEAVDESVDQGPTGGHTWDGRVDTTHDQARLPLTSPLEMANDGMESVCAKVERSSYAPKLKTVFGDDVFDDPTRASTAVLLSLEVFQQSPPDFYPYSSRYDRWLRHQLELSPRELHGLALFQDAKKGNCASCHPSQIRHGAFPQFTDFGYIALGVPRNREIPANKDPGFFDMGLCGPQRTDLASHKEYCGEFRVPSLRNVATRRAFFHNGVFHRLEQVMEFYAERDTHPAKWYRAAGGRVDAYDDLPKDYRTNVNREPPFGGKAGNAPVLTHAEIDDVIAFLKTLTDADLDAN